jgi:hypothetical protein
MPLEILLLALHAYNLTKRRVHYFAWFCYILMVQWGRRGCPTLEETYHFSFHASYLYSILLALHVYSLTKRRVHHLAWLCYILMVQLGRRRRPPLEEIYHFLSMLLTSVKSILCSLSGRDVYASDDDYFHETSSTVGSNYCILVGDAFLGAFFSSFIFYFQHKHDAFFWPIRALLSFYSKQLPFVNS